MQAPDANTVGIIFNIQKFSIHDGPGIRTTVFLKGCPLRCRWCCNPESQKKEPEISRNTVRCTGCGHCRDICPNNAVKRYGDTLSLDRTLCQVCGTCADKCPAQAIEIIGRKASAAEVAERAAEDALFYRGEGGITLSGGEVLMQGAFVAAVCAESHRHGISTAIETSAYGSFDALQRICHELDYMLVDIKHMDSREHKIWTGVGNERILENIKNVRREFPDLPVTVRCPVIPGCNDTRENIAATARFVGDLPGARLELLPYHRLGEGKYSNLGMTFSLAELAPPPQTVINEFRSLAAEYAPVV